MSIVLQGSTSGSITLQEPAVAGSNTLTLPAATGTVAITSDFKEIGVGQTWQDVSGSRASGTTYTNSTGKPIQVMVLTENNGNTTYDSAGAAKYSIGGVVVGQMYTNNNSNTSGLFQAVIPNGVTYSVSASIIRTWYELR